jgi:hypothetical protein
MRPVINFNAVKATVDELFEILESIKPPAEYIEQAEKAGIENPLYRVSVRTDTKKTSSLEKVLQKRKAKYFSKMFDGESDASMETQDFRDFLEEELREAQSYQIYFDKYKSDKEHRKYHYDLERWIVFLDLIINPIVATTKKEKGPSGRAVALFCSIVHQSGILLRSVESKSDYCKKIMKERQIMSPNVEEVRKHFTETMGIKESDKYLQEVVLLILPTLLAEERGIIEKFIQGNIPDKAKMYH